MKRTLLTLCVLTTAVGCASEGVTCTAASLSQVFYEDKTDFEGQWTQVSTLTEIDGDLPLMVGAESPARVVEWEVSEDFLFVSGWEFAYTISGHATAGKTQDGHSCTIRHVGHWSERGLFRVDFSQEHAARPIPGAAAEWTVEPSPYFVEPGLPESPRSFLRDAEGRLETVVLPNRYFVTTCEECIPVQVTVSHRFERLD